MLTVFLAVNNRWQPRLPSHCFRSETRWSPNRCSGTIRERPYCGHCSVLVANHAQIFSYIYLCCRAGFVLAPVLESICSVCASQRLCANYGPQRPAGGHFLEIIDAAATKRNNALMACASGMILELVVAPRCGSAANAAPMRFAVNDVANADQWLEQEGVRVIGKPVLATSGPDARQILVNFVAPWVCGCNWQDQRAARSLHCHNR
jgi:hypothetical protein